MSLPALENSEPCRRILVVDDDPLTLYALETTLKTEFVVVGFTDPHAALLAARETPFAAVISDQRMIGMLGLDLLARIRELQPNATRMLITGLLSVQTLMEAINRGEIYRFIAKPWSTAELLATAANAVQRFQLLEENAALQRATLRLNEDLVSANRELEKRIGEIGAQHEEITETVQRLHSGRLRLYDFCNAVLTTFDPLAGARARYMAELCHLLAEAANLGDELRETLLATAWCCDLGLIAYPQDFVESCLNGLSDPNSEASLLYRAHPLHSQKLTLTAGFSGAIGAAVRAHHERYDGNGFPDGLVGNEIPEAARWLAPVEFFASSGPDRGTALADLERLTGTAFDPHVMRHFMKIALRLPLPQETADRNTVAVKPAHHLARQAYLAAG